VVQGASACYALPFGLQQDELSLLGSARRLFLCGVGPQHTSLLNLCAHFTIVMFMSHLLCHPLLPQVQAMGDLIKAGKIKHWGVSNETTYGEGAAGHTFSSNKVYTVVAQLPRQISWAIGAHDQLPVL
jgi:hypothetical protein